MYSLANGQDAEVKVEISTQDQILYNQKIKILKQEKEVNIKNDHSKN